MAWNGSGSPNRVEDFTADLAAGPPDSYVSADKVDNEFDNFKTMMTNCLARDGQNSPSANIVMAGYKITGLGTPTSGTDATTKTYVDTAVASASVSDGAITTAKMADGAVTTIKVADDAVTLAKQAAGTANRLQGFDGSGNPAEVAASARLALSSSTLVQRLVATPQLT
jgi:hypothetical protein